MNSLELEVYNQRVIKRSSESDGLDNSTWVRASLMDERRKLQGLDLKIGLASAGTFLAALSLTNLGVFEASIGTILSTIIAVHTTCAFGAVSFRNLEIFGLMHEQGKDLVEMQKLSTRIKDLKVEVFSRR